MKAYAFATFILLTMIYVNMPAPKMDNDLPRQS